MTREDWVTATGLLRAYLRDDLVLARALRERRWADLAAVADLANGEVDNRLAVTDPALYRALREAVTKYHIRGYGCLDVDKLRRMAGRK
ncbi:hypothetical protein [Cereibacter johrii]|uniref:hypothetical protein n=1 Tax=Cereibacter johrii TaxID=445629 RepID=UPI000DCDD116|nr:hypothetical protein [Cereibacter johrii]RAZ83429.1 hypothetical protein DDV93_14055 [Cereibacter johrii]